MSLFQHYFELKVGAYIQISIEAILKNSNINGHVPQEIHRECWYLLQKSGSEITCIVNSDRRRFVVEGKESVVLCVYIFRGKREHLDRLIPALAKLNA